MQEIEALYMVNSKDWSKTNAAPANNFFKTNSDPIKLPQNTQVQPQQEDDERLKKLPETVEAKGDIKREDIQLNPPAAALDFKVIDETPKKNAQKENQPKKKKEKEKNKC